MTMISIWIVIGVIVGWHIPQPSWAKAVQSYVYEKWTEFRAKK